MNIQPEKQIQIFETVPTRFVADSTVCLKGKVVNQLAKLKNYAMIYHGNCVDKPTTAFPAHTTFENVADDASGREKV